MTLDIINRDNVSDNATLNLNLPHQVATAEVGGITYLFVPGLLDNGVSVFAVGADGVLTNVENVNDDATLNLAGALNVATAVVGGTTYLIVAGNFDDGLSVFEVAAGGTLINVDNVADDATTLFESPNWLTTAVVGGTTYLFAVGANDNGLSVFEVGATGVLTNVDNIADDATLMLTAAISATAVAVGGTTFLFVAGLLDAGVSVFEVGSDGRLTNVSNVADNATVNLLNPSGVTTAVVGGTTYLFVAAFGDSGVSVFEVGSDGSLFNVENVSDNATLNLSGANSVTTAVVGGTTYLFVTSGLDNGVSVFEVGTDGSLVNVANIADDASLELEGAAAATTAVVGGTSYLFVSGGDDNGISTFELSNNGALIGTNLSDTLVGTSAADTIEGLGANDVILGLADNDALNGGDGADTLTGGDGDDTLTGGAGDDDLYGDAGTDTAVFSGNQADYLVLDLGDGSFEVADQRAGAPDGTDILRGIEVIAFADSTISLVGNDAPTDIALSHNTVAENSAAGALVGVLSATDPDTGETFTYQLIDDAGGRFRITGNLIEVAGALDFETATSHQVTVRVTDSGGLTRDETFSIGVTDVAEDAPTGSSGDLNIVNRDNVTDDAILNLRAASSVATAAIGGVTYLFVAGPADNGVSVFEVATDGSLTSVRNVNDDASLELQGASSVTTAVIGGAHYLFVAGAADDGISAFTIGAGGVLTNVANVTDDAILRLGGVISLATGEVGGITFLFAAGENGISVFAPGPGTLANVSNIVDDATLHLEGIQAVTTVEALGATFLIAAGGFGISGFTVNGSGQLSNIFNISDTPSLALLGGSALTTAVVDGETYVFAAGFADGGVSVFVITGNGSLRNIDNVLDSPARLLGGASSLVTAVVEGTTYLFVGSETESGVTVFSVGAGGALSHVGNIADSQTLALAGTSSLATALIGGVPHLFAAGGNEDGVSTFALSRDLTLVGSDSPDTLDGGAGDDLVFGLGADDLVRGGQGDDTLFGGDGNDTLVGGAGTDELHGDASIDTAEYSGNQAEYLFLALPDGTFRVTDQRTGGPDGVDTLIGIEQLRFADGTISLIPNAAPTDIALSHNTVAENSAAGALVGVLSASDPDTGDTFTYQLLDDAGGRFRLNGNLIQVAGALDFETATSHQVIVRVIDSGGLSRDETFTIAVTDVAEGTTPGRTGLSIVNTDNVTDDATLALDSAQSVATAMVDGVTYLFVAGIAESGVSVFRVDADGALVNVANVFDDATLNLGFAASVTTATVGGTTYLFAAGAGDNGVSVLRVETGGSLANVANVTDDATLQLNAAIALATAAVDGVIYLFVAGSFDNGVSVFAVGADGSLANVANVTDDATLRLGNALSVATALVGGVTYLFAAGGDDGVSVFRVDAGGSLANVDNFEFGAAADLDFSGVTSLATAVVGGVTYLFTAVDDFDAGAATTFSGVRVFEVAADGSLAPVDDIGDSPARFLDQDAGGSLTTATIGGIAYLFVASNADAGLSVFSIGAGGVLSNVANIGDDATLELLGASSVTTAVAGGISYLFAAGAGDDGVSVFALASDDTLTGTGAADTLDGAGGNDRIVGLGGNDTLIGGRGNDKLTGGTGDDELSGDAGNDRIAGGAGADTLLGGVGNDTYSVDSAGDIVTELPDEGTDTVRALVDYMLGANVERLKLIGSADIDGTGNALDNVITGNSGSNVIRGGEGRDILSGKAGDDTFVFTSAAETGVGADRDVIRDFEDFGDNDTIDLSGFAGTLTFSSAATFSGVLNEVIAVQSGADVLIRINTATGAEAEAEIRLTDTLLSQINASDFDLV